MLEVMVEYTIDWINNGDLDDYFICRVFLKMLLISL